MNLRVGRIGVFRQYKRNIYGATSIEYGLIVAVIGMALLWGVTPFKNSMSANMHCTGAVSVQNSNEEDYMNRCIPHIKKYLDEGGETQGIPYELNKLRKNPKTKTLGQPR